VKTGRTVRCTEIAVVNGQLVQGWIGASHLEIADAIDAAVREQFERMKKHPADPRGSESRSSRSSPGHQGTEGRPSPSACETTRTGYDAPVVAP
jgi:hypothetical protein